MTHSIELSPELYHILQRQATVLNATVESLVETAVRRNYAQPSPTASRQVHKDDAVALPYNYADLHFRARKRFIDDKHSIRMIKDCADSADFIATVVLQIGLNRATFAKNLPCPAASQEESA